MYRIAKSEQMSRWKIKVVAIYISCSSGLIARVTRNNNKCNIVNIYVREGDVFKKIFKYILIGKEKGVSQIFIDQNHFLGGGGRNIAK